MVDTMVPNSGPWSLLGQSVSYIIKLALILRWALPSGPAVLCPKSTNASTYDWLPHILSFVGALPLIYYQFRYHPLVVFAHQASGPAQGCNCYPYHEQLLTEGSIDIGVCVKSLLPLALDRTIFLRRTKKSGQKLAKPLNSLEDLAHTIDERFVLAYPS
ncbi:hypothetical protein DSO57_1013849 [Entomophthora muscae]|uniref:Uncharacterized protein n=1 Tax=Entomophthora muscae TaxID=34485 RepID=A0ACC2T5Z7_9FUNG|nr:hypothetical protein DSO57_1013849 [Entomophthora muscae]